MSLPDIREQGTFFDADQILKRLVKRAGRGRNASYSSPKRFGRGC